MKPAQLRKAGIRGTGYQASRLHSRPCVTSGRGVLPVTSPFITTTEGRAQPDRPKDEPGGTEHLADYYRATFAKQERKPHTRSPCSSGPDQKDLRLPTFKSLLDKGAAKRIEGQVRICGVPSSPVRPSASCPTAAKPGRSPAGLTSTSKRPGPHTARQSSRKRMHPRPMTGRPPSGPKPRAAPAPPPGPFQSAKRALSSSLDDGWSLRRIWSCTQATRFRLALRKSPMLMTADTKAAPQTAHVQSAPGVVHKALPAVAHRAAPHEKKRTYVTAMAMNTACAALVFRASFNDSHSHTFSSR